MRRHHGATTPILAADRYGKSAPLRDTEPGSSVRGGISSGRCSVNILGAESVCSRLWSSVRSECSSRLCRCWRPRYPNPGISEWSSSLARMENVKAPDATLTTGYCIQGRLTIPCAYPQGIRPDDTRQEMRPWMDSGSMQWPARWSHGKHDAARCAAWLSLLAP